MHCESLVLFFLSYHQHWPFSVDVRWTLGDDYYLLTSEEQVVVKLYPPQNGQFI